MKKDISIDKELFTPLTAEEKKVNSVVRPSVGYWKDVWSRLKSNKMALTSLIIIIVIMFSAFILPLFLPYTYDGTNLEIANTKFISLFFSSKSAIFVVILQIWGVYAFRNEI